MKRREHRFALIMLSPTIILLAGLILFPVVYSVYLSFSKLIISRSPDPEFIGLGNYVEIFRNSIFLSSLWKTAYYSVTYLAATTVTGFFAALLLNMDFKGKNFVITCLLIPWAIPKVVNGLIWKWIFDGNYGILNAILLRLGIIDQYQFWFGTSPFIGILFISLANAWKNMPFVALLVLAALQTIPKDYYEAAKMDGASAVRRFTSITLPQLKYTLIVVLILQTTAAIKVFDMIAVLTQGGPGDLTMVTYYYIYRVAFDYLNIGLGAAGSYVMTIVIVALALVYYKVLGGSKDE
jgi:multiple sugar transport system permease protein